MASAAPPATSPPARRWCVPRQRREPPKAAVDALELYARQEIESIELHERNRAQLAFLRSEVDFYPIADAETAKREEHRREEGRDRFLLLKSERIARSSAENRTSSRLTEASSVLLLEYNSIQTSLLGDQGSEFKRLTHAFAVNRPDTNNRNGWNSSAARKPSPPKQERLRTTNQATSPRPPTTFPDDRFAGRRRYLEDKQLAALHGKLRDTIDQCQKEEDDQRFAAVGQEAMDYMRIEATAIVDVEQARSRADARKSLEAVAAKVSATKATREHAVMRAACTLQRWARCIKARRHAMSRRHKFAHASSVRIHRERDYTRCLEVQTWCRAAASERLAHLAREAQRPVPTEDEGAAQLPILVSEDVEATVAAADQTPLPVSERAMFVALSRASKTVPHSAAVHCVLAAAVKPLLVAEQQLIVIPSRDQPYWALNSIACCLLQHPRTGRCGVGMLAICADIAERTAEHSHSHCERLLRRNNVVMKPVPEEVRTRLDFGHRRGMQLLADSAFEAELTSREVMALQYLEHASRALEEGLVHGRVDSFEDRWRPYTSVSELFEEERQVVMNQEFVDRVDLAKHERNCFADIFDLRKALESAE